VYNDPALAQRLRGALEAALGKDNVVMEEPITASEDFSYFVEQGIPGFYFSLGGADPEKFAKAKATGVCCRRIILRCLRQMLILHCGLGLRRRWRC